MNLSLDGYTAAPGDELGWSVPSYELLRSPVRPGWDDGPDADGCKPWKTMSSHWPTADQQPGGRRRSNTPAAGETWRKWCSPQQPARSTHNARVVTDDTVTKITRLKTAEALLWTLAAPPLPARPCGPGLAD